MTAELLGHRTVFDLNSDHYLFFPKVKDIIRHASTSKYGLDECLKLCRKLTRIRNLILKHNNLLGPVINPILSHATVYSHSLKCLQIEDDMRLKMGEKVPSHARSDLSSTLQAAQSDVQIQFPTRRIISSASELKPGMLILSNYTNLSIPDHSVILITGVIRDANPVLCRVEGIVLNQVSRYHSIPIIEEQIERLKSMSNTSSNSEHAKHIELPMRRYMPPFPDLNSYSNSPVGGYQSVGKDIYRRDAFGMPGHTQGPISDIWNDIDFNLLGCDVDRMARRVQVLKSRLNNSIIFDKQKDKTQNFGSEESAKQSTNNKTFLRLQSDNNFIKKLKRYFGVRRSPSVRQDIISSVKFKTRNIGRNTKMNNKEINDDAFWNEKDSDEMKDNEFIKFMQKIKHQSLNKESTITSASPIVVVDGKGGEKCIKISIRPSSSTTASFKNERTNSEFKITFQQESPSKHLTSSDDDTAEDFYFPLNEKHAASSKNLATYPTTSMKPDLQLVPLCVNSPSSIKQFPSNYQSIFPNYSSLHSIDSETSKSIPAELSHSSVLNRPYETSPYNQWILNKLKQSNRSFIEWKTFWRLNLNDSHHHPINWSRLHTQFFRRRLTSPEFPLRSFQKDKGLIWSDDSSDDDDKASDDEVTLAKPEEDVAKERTRPRRFNRLKKIRNFNSSQLQDDKLSDTLGSTEKDSGISPGVDDIVDKRRRSTAKSQNKVLYVKDEELFSDSDDDDGDESDESEEDGDDSSSNDTDDEDDMFVYGEHDNGQFFQPQQIEQPNKNNERNQMNPILLTSFKLNETAINIFPGQDNNMDYMKIHFHPPSPLPSLNSIPEAPLSTNETNTDIGTVSSSTTTSSCEDNERFAPLNICEPNWGGPFSTCRLCILRVDPFSNLSSRSTHLTAGLTEISDNVFVSHCAPSPMAAMAAVGVEEGESMLSPEIARERIRDRRRRFMGGYLPRGLSPFEKMYMGSWAENIVDFEDRLKNGDWLVMDAPNPHVLNFLMSCNEPSHVYLSLLASYSESGKLSTALPPLRVLVASEVGAPTALLSSATSSLGLTLRYENIQLSAENFEFEPSPLRFDEFVHSPEPN